jgi:hypothetical protein
MSTNVFCLSLVATTFISSSLPDILTSLRLKS